MPHIKPAEYRDAMVEIAEHYLAAGLTIGEVCAEFSAIVLGAALRDVGGNICHCATKHRIHRNTLARRMKLAGISRLRPVGRPKTSIPKPPKRVEAITTNKLYPGA